MSGHAALGFYTEPGNQAPSEASERSWKGVLYRGNGYPDALGASLLAGLAESRGDLQAFTQKWILSPDPEDVSDEGPSDLLIGNAAFCYVLDRVARRLDVFATYVGADGVLVGSASIDEAGLTNPPSFEHWEMPEGEDENEELTSPDWIGKVEEFFDSARRIVSVEPGRAKAALVHASELEARCNPRYHLDDFSNLPRRPSVGSFTRAGRRHSIDGPVMLELVDRIGSEILRSIVPSLEFLLAPSGRFWEKRRIHTFVLRGAKASTALSSEERQRLHTDVNKRKEVAEPYIACDWCLPFIVWTNASRLRLKRA